MFKKNPSIILKQAISLAKVVKKIILRSKQAQDWIFEAQKALIVVVVWLISKSEAITASKVEYTSNTTCWHL